MQYPYRSRFLLAIAVVGVFAIALSTATPAWSQATISTGAIQGTITDPTGAVVPGAKVTITNTATGQQLALITNNSGAFTSGALHPGDYTVKVAAKGFQTVTQTVNVQVGNVSSTNLKLTLGSESQVVEVSGEAVRVNTEQPTVQGVLDSKQIENLPTGGRNFLDLAQLEPGVQIQDGGNFDPTKNGFSSISFGGRYGRTARISVDGIDVSDETVGTTTQNISAGAISEFQLSQSTLDLSTELTSSGAVNVVTKSGTNAIHGEGFYLFRDKSFAANFPGGQDTYYQRNHYGGSLGGPIIKDKLFWFANAEHVRQALVVPLSPPDPFTSLPRGYPAPFYDTQTLGRLDWQGPHGIHAFYRFTYNYNKDVAAYGATYQPFANRDNTPAHGLGVDFTTGNFTHSFRFGYLKFQNHIADAVTGNSAVYNPGEAAGVAIRIGPAGVVTRFGPSRLAPQATFQSNHQLKYDGSWLHGNHIIRYGFDFNAIRGGGFASFYGLAPEIRTNNNASAEAAAAAGPFPGGDANPLNYPISSILMGNGQGYFTETPAFGYPAGGQSDNRIGLYVGDTWKIKPNFTLTYGVRWDRDTGRQDSDLPAIRCDQVDAALFGGQVPCTGSDLLLNQFGGNYGAAPRQPNTNFGPQIGFTWDPWGTGKTVFRAGSGIYYENAVFNNVLFDRPGRLPNGLFWGYAVPCPSGQLQLPSGLVSSVTVNGQTIDIANDICGQPVGVAMGLVGQLQKYYQEQIAAAGASANPNFLGETLANGDNSTGNNFIAPNYRTPRSYQMNVGVQHEIRPGLVLSADYIRNVGLHYLIGWDTNHVGDSRFYNQNAALNAVNGVIAGINKATVDGGIAAGCPIATGLGASSQAAVTCYISAEQSALAANNPNAVTPTIQDFANNGLDSGATYLAGFPASLYGLTPDTGAAFGGINPLVGENTMLFPAGRSVYNGLQVKLIGRRGATTRFLSAMSYQISYALSRFDTMVADQDFINTAYDFRNPTRYFGPGSMDRTNQLSFGGYFQIAHGPLISLVGHFFSPLAQDMLLENQFRPGEIFNTDLTGDGTGGDVLPGTNVGSFGRTYNASNINNVISAFNSKYSGQLTPAGQVVVGSGLMTADQMSTLGAVIDSVPLAPQNQVNLGWLKTFDLKFAWPIKLGERFTIEPSASAYNVFNFANFDSGGNLMTAVLNGQAPAVNGTDPTNHDSTRIGLGTGVNTSGAPRQLQFGLKVTF